MSDRQHKVNTRRNLRTARPLWAATPRITVEAGKEPTRLDYDVVILGGGISGALVAQALADGKRRILLVDRRQPVRGSTIASTAMIQHELDTPLHQLAAMVGQEKAMRAWARSAASVQALKQLIDRLEIDCSFESRKTLYLSGNDYGARALKTEIDMREKAGLSARYLGPAELGDEFAIDRTAAILSDCSASSNPAQMTAGLLRAAQERGVEIVSPLDMTDFRETRDGVVVATASGRLLMAGDLVACTGYEFFDAMNHPAHRIVSTWAIATEPHADRPRWLDDFLVWEASEPYLYFRTTPDGRIIAGGEDEDDPQSHRDQDKGRRKFAVIAGKLQDLLDCRAAKLAYGWAAPFGTTKTGLPIIDRVPGTTHVHAVMGFGGNGITFSKIAAEMISARINGRTDPDEDLFRYPD